MSTGISATMFKKITGFLVRRKSGDISPSEAEKIQKASYALVNADIKKKFSPVYLSILNGLDSDEKQIFEATAYYLTKIAQNKSKYKENILNIMDAKAKEGGINPEFREILKNEIQKITLKNNL
ncbi:MAG: hypothetical protein NC218_06120 [Acetobacter sp.]|nr:hypothetical protein [Acetobacter sp.]